jgi:hypothetical protein
MHDQPIQEESEEFARLDGAILGLLVDPDDQRPWAETEVAREIGGPGNIFYAVDRLYHAGLIHRWGGLVSATRAAVRLYDIEQSQEPHSEYERRTERSVMGLLLAPSRNSTAPLSVKEIRRAIGANSLDLTDALDRLYSAGLMDRVDELAFASDAAARFDQIMTL